MVYALVVFNTGNAGAAVRVVFDVLNGGGYAVCQVKVNQTVKTAGATTLMTGSNAALVVAAGGIWLWAARGEHINRKARSFFIADLRGANGVVLRYYVPTPMRSSQGITWCRTSFGDVHF